jgi:uncharacterized protein (TIGR02284 family)
MAFGKLTKLHTTLIDARNGYDEAAKDASEPRVTEFFRGMIALHGRHADELGTLLRELGANPDDSASFLSVVHRTVVRVRSAIVNLDASELQPFISGEEQIVAEYDDAAVEAGGNSAALTLLNRQKAALLEKIGAMKSMISATGRG